MIDPDLFSPFRFGLVIQVTKPCEEDRAKILKHVLVQELNLNTLISIEIDLRISELASMTRGFTGTRFLPDNLLHNVFWVCSG